MRVDGTAITETNLRNWQRAVGYVPQQIFLIDDSVSANIAFGIRPEDRNQAAIEAAARREVAAEFGQRYAVGDAQAVQGKCQRDIRHLAPTAACHRIGGFAAQIDCGV